MIYLGIMFSLDKNNMRERMIPFDLSGFFNFAPVVYFLNSGMISNEDIKDLELDLSSGYYDSQIKDYNHGKLIVDILKSVGSKVEKSNSINNKLAINNLIINIEKYIRDLQGSQIIVPLINYAQLPINNGIDTQPNLSKLEGEPDDWYYNDKEPEIPNLYQDSSDIFTEFNDLDEESWKVNISNDKQL